MKRAQMNTFYGKIILVTGGTGSIGSEIVRQLIPFHPKQIRIYSRDESKHYEFQQELQYDKKAKVCRFLIGDVRDKERLGLAMNGVDMVFHAAALKHVPYCEYNPFEAIKTNITGTQNVIELALFHEVKKVIAISTDKAVNPNTVMGITKLMMERLVISAHNYLGPAKTKFAVVRFGNVLMSRGSVVPTWIEQIKRGGPVTVTDKRMKRYFMTIPDAVRAVFDAVTNMLGQEVFVLTMKEKDISTLAEETIQKYGNGKSIKIIVTGSRDREKLAEKLFTDEEEQYKVVRKTFTIILPNKQLAEFRKKLYL